MPRRSIKAYLNGLKQQVVNEQVKLDELLGTQTKLVAEIAAQAAKVEALRGVMTSLTPPNAPKAK